jgi:hypothetical protein
MVADFELARSINRRIRSEYRVIDSFGRGVAVLRDTLAGKLRYGNCDGAARLHGPQFIRPRVTCEAFH